MTPSPRPPNPRDSRALRALREHLSARARGLPERLHELPKPLHGLPERARRWARENVPIRAWLALWCALLLALILLLFSFVTYTIAADQLRASVQQTIQGRATAIASALQREQPVAATDPTPAPTPTLQATPPPPQGTPTPVSTPDPATSAAIQKQLSLTVPEVLSRLDLGFEVLDANGRPRYIAAALGAEGLPLDVGIINAVLRGAPGASYTTHSRTGLLAVYVQPIVFQPRAASQVDHAGEARQSGQPATHAGPAQVVGVVLAAKPLDDVNHTLLTLRQVLVLGDIFAILLALLGGWFIARRGLLPIAGVTRAARAIAINAHAAGLGTRVGYSGPRDEVGELVATFNDMLAALERVAGAQRRFVQDASHELRAPLTSIKGNLDLLRRNMDAPHAEREEMLTDAAAEAGRLAALVNDLLTLARVDAAASDGVGLREAWLDEQLRGRREPIEMDALVMDVFRQGRAQLQARHKDLRLTVSELEPMTVLGDPGQIRQLVTILLDNAIKYTPSGGRVCLGVKRTEDGWAEMVAEDDGIGIAPEDQPRIFDRFFRADHARARDEQGSGLGLAIARWIVQAHGGTVAVQSALGRGSTFTVRLKAERRAGEPTLPRLPVVHGGKPGASGLLSGAMQPLARRLASSVSRPLAAGPRERGPARSSARHARPAGEGARGAKGATGAAKSPPARLGRENGREKRRRAKE